MEKGDRLPLPHIRPVLRALGRSMLQVSHNIPMSASDHYKPPVEPVEDMCLVFEEQPLGEVPL